MSRHEDVVRLTHMRDYATEAVAMAATGSREALPGDRMRQLALMHLVEIVGEAATRVSEQTAASCPAIPWKQVTGMRHRIVHGYDKVDLRLLWDTIADDFPPLVAALEEAIARIEDARRG